MKISNETLFQYCNFLDIALALNCFAKSKQFTIDEEETWNSRNFNFIFYYDLFQLL